MGGTLLRLGRLEEAGSALRRSIALSPTAGAWSNLGTCEYLLGRHPEAAHAFEQAIGLVPRDLRYRVSAGDAYRLAPGLAEKARASYDKALELADAERAVHPLDAASLALVAKAEVRTDRREAAQKTTQEALALQPENHTVLFRAAIVENVLGRKAEALTLLRKAVERGMGTTQIARDPEFADLKDNSEFQKLITPTPAAR
jgi:tetratricopeptide (TPR) repeat protein